MVEGEKQLKSDADDLFLKSVSIVLNCYGSNKYSLEVGCIKMKMKIKTRFYYGTHNKNSQK
jgi:hypothetical protein